MNGKRKGFTLVELLTVIAIIALLLSLAVPALNEARMRARIVGDQASLRVVNNAVENFANDMTYYPDSDQRHMLLVQGGQDNTNWDQGAHRLFEALAGMDYIGYQKDHYYNTNVDGKPIDINDAVTERWGPYVKLESVKIGTMQDAHPGGENWAAGNNNPVFMDTLDAREPRAILYYRAHASKTLLPQIFNYADNQLITQDTIGGDPYYEDFDAPEEFYKFVWNPDTGYPPGGSTAGPASYTNPSARPYNMDSFILINAGRDHEYGTADDITNFK
ncbi:MAG: type II secretion system protein [Sedimentisphaerales bacterium]|nr:type II secretion system protein [Sedimentisphaerales bacterium]